MRDEERISSYYKFNTTDYHSEKCLNDKRIKRSVLSPPGYLKRAALVWVLALKNLSPSKSD